MSSEFRRVLEHAYEHGYAVPSAQALQYLSNYEGLCPFGVACAHFVLAAYSNADPAFRAHDDADGVRHPITLESRRFVGKGQVFLHQWSTLQKSIYDLITTRWPVWRALDRLTKADISSQPASLRDSANSIELVFCGPGWPGLQFALAGFSSWHGWKLHFVMADVHACPSFYMDIARVVPEGMPIALLSPLLWAWTADSEIALLNVIEILTSDSSMHVAGFPTVDRDGLWNLNVWRLRLHDWKLAFEAYPTGYEAIRGDRCFRSEATSATRVFRNASLWRSYLANTWAELSASDDPLLWLVDLDLQIHAAHAQMYTCMGPSMREDAYLAKVGLTANFVKRHRVEVAHFSAENYVERCLDSSGWSDLATSSAIPLPVCLDREARLALEFALQRWNDFCSEEPLYLRVDLSSALLLLTHGGTVLDRQRSLNDAPISLSACCRKCVDDAHICAVHGMSRYTPSGLHVEVNLTDESLVFRSSRMGVPLLALNTTCSSHIAVGAPTLVNLHGFPSNLRVLHTAAVSGSPLHTTLPQIEVLFCCQSPELETDVRNSVHAHGWHVHSLVADPQQCFVFLQEVVTLLDETSVVVLISPLLWMWDARSSVALSQGLWLLRNHSEAKVLGFPTIHPDRTWRWNVRRIRHQYWKLTYTLPKSSKRVFSVPCSDAFACIMDALCATDDVTSGTRVFQSAAVFKTLFPRVGFDVDNPSNWLVDLDLQMHGEGLDVLTCTTLPMPEIDYVSRANLTTFLSEKHQVEVARFLGSQFELCLKGGNWFQVVQKGLVAPWCFRRDITYAFQGVSRWWKSLDPLNNFVVPEEGTFLALFRNGAAGMLPWDSDFDVKLYTAKHLTAEGFMNHTKDATFKSMEIEAYSYKGCGQDDYVLLRRPNITHHIGDMYIRGDQTMLDYPWRANLFGTEVRISPEHLHHIFFRRYRTPVRKLFGDGIVLQCFHPGHNACLPDCRDEDMPCDFEDDFVHVDCFDSAVEQHAS